MDKEKLLHKAYDVIMSALAVLASVLIVIDATQNLKKWERALFIIVYLLFFADLVIRLTKAGDKHRFLKRNYMDILALLPVHGVILFGSGTLDNVLSVLGLLRIIAFLSRPLRKLKSFYNTNGFKYVVFATLMTIITGGVLIHYAEGMAFDDGIWWAFVTATTVGYGDISPHTTYGRLIAMALMLVGIGLIGSLTSTLTSFFLSRHKKRTSDPVLSAVRDELDHFETLTPQEVDRLCEVLRSLKK